ncbi:AMP-binding protein [Kitasatospora herbaricolor]|uniref:AMP-binding protein n=1 Tax=Kitasatospora herbaricolor TaxID=68217 RepID=A0ABZ1W919_9ACTN|nr:AMP-binding protein [Kitasatospora herbaricolor]
MPVGTLPTNPLYEDFHERAVRRPDAPALHWHDTVVDYGGLAALADLAYAELAAHPGGPVALPARKSPRAIALVLACLRAGRPLLLVSESLGRRTLDQLVERAGCGWLAEAGEHTTGWTDLGPARPGAAALDPAAACLVLTTSGSTGTPKLVPLGAAALDRFTRWAHERFGLGEGRTVLNYAPLNFDLCLLDIWATLRSGGCAALVDPEHAVDPRRLVELFERTRPQVVQAVPMLFRILAEAGAAPTPEVRHVVLTGDHTPLPVRRALPGLFPAAEFHSVYGCTETNDSFLHTLGPADLSEGETVPLGRPLPGVRTALAGPDGLLAGAGTGELLVATPFQTDGYLADRDQGGRFTTAADGTRYFRSGDLVTRAEGGTLTLVGRTDFQVKVRGVRVSLEEVERVLLGHPEIAEAGVLALPDPAAGVRLHAVVRRRSERLNSLALRAYCAERLSKAAIPAAFRLTGEPLPSTSTGKVDRGRLRAELLEEST